MFYLIHAISCFLLNLAWMLLLYLWLLSYLLSLYLETLNLFYHIWESSGLVSYIMTIGNIPFQYESCWRYVVNICFFIDFYCGIVIFLILMWDCYLSHLDLTFLCLRYLGLWMALMCIFYAFSNLWPTRKKISYFCHSSLVWHQAAMSTIAKYGS